MTARGEQATRRGEILTFRMSPEERRDLQLLACAEQTNKSALIRGLVRERLAELTGSGGEQS